MSSIPSGSPGSPLHNFMQGKGGYVTKTKIQWGFFKKIYEVEIKQGDKVLGTARTSAGLFADKKSVLEATEAALAKALDTPLTDGKAINEKGQDIIEFKYETIKDNGNWISTLKQDGFSFKNCGFIKKIMQKNNLESKVAVSSNILISKIPV